MNHTEYLAARMAVDANQKAVREWLTAHKTNGIPVAISATMPYSDIATNALKGKIELYEWHTEPPEREFVYINENKGIATSWMGDNFGSVSFGNEWRDNFGSTRQSITVYGSNGVNYYGTYFKGAGEYARIKAVKNQTRFLEHAATEKEMGRYNQILASI